MSQHFIESKESREVKKRLKTVAFAFITPIFFIVGGLKVSLTLIMMALPSFLGLLFVRQLSKLSGVYFVTIKYFKTAQIYTTLLLNTGLTFGLIASLFGLNEGYIDQIQYSLLTGVLITSTVIPTLIAQKWLLPLNQEDVLD